MRKLYKLLFLFFASLLANYAMAYDFYSVCSTGQTLGYSITSDTMPYTVAVAKSSFSMPGNVVIPETVENENVVYTVTSIGDSAFYFCTGMTSLVIPNTVTSIGLRAFDDCRALASVEIPNSVTEIGAYAFYYCTSLESLTIPENVMNIGFCAFRYCSALTTVNYNATNCTTMGGSADVVFRYCTSLTTINIGENVISIPSYAFSECNSVATLTIPSSVDSIGTNAFLYVRNIVYDGTAEGSPWGALTINGHVEGDLVYADEAKTILAGCSATVTSVEIPNTVTEIGSNAFRSCKNLTSVTLPNSVTSVGDYVFLSCSGLTEPIYNDTWFAFLPSGTAEYTIPEGIQHIAGGAFYGYNGGLTSVTIPNTVTTIGYQAFYYCTTLTSITIPESVDSIGNEAFYNCSNMTTVNFNATNCTYMGDSNHPVLKNCNALTTLNIGENVTRIPDDAFYNCGSFTGPLVIPDSVTYIGAGAFCWCEGFTEITIGKKVDTVGVWAFSGCSSATTFNYNAENCIDMSNDYYWAFNACSSLTTLNIGENVKSIPQNAFRLCNFTEVTIPDSVTYIGDNAFIDCSHLTTVNFNAINCAAMGSGNDAVFARCNSLTTLNIGNKVKSIPECAFYGCSSLTGPLILPDSLSYIGNSAFSGCTGLNGTLTIPRSVDSIGAYAFYHCSGLTGLNFNAANCTLLGSNPNIFTGCTSLVNLNIGENVTNIPGDLFSNCSSLIGDLVIPNSVTNISDYAFFQCTGFSSITIGDSVTSIGDYAFYGCSGMENVVIGNSVESIGYFSFGDCIGLTSVTIPSSVTSIGQRVFSGCSSLTRVNYNATNCTTMGNSSYPPFKNCPITTLHIAENVTYIPYYAFSENPDIANIYVYSSTPPTLQSAYNVFSSSVYNSATVWTPCPAATNYRSDSRWGQFANIQNEQTSIYNIAVQTADANMGDVSGDGSFTCDTEVELIATPSDGYRFLSWNDGNEDNPRTITVGGDSTFVASFRAIHTITASASVGGTISPSGEITVDEDADQSFTIAPANCYRLASVLVDGVEAIDEMVGGVYTFTGVTTDHTIEAIFEMLTYTISVTASEHGTVTHEGNDGDAVVNCGSSQSFTITPETYYRILSVIVDGQDVTSQLVDGVYTFSNVTADHTIAVTFEIITYTIDASANNDEFGSVSGGGTYDAGSEISLTATPNNGYRFVSWNDANTDNSRTLIVTSDSTLVATFVRSQFAITAISSDPDGGSVMGGGTYSEGDTATLTATPSIGYCFISWSDGNTDNPRMVEVVQDSTFVAEFSATVHRAVDTTVTSYLSVDEHTFYVSGVYSYIIPSDIGCDTIVNLTLQVLDEPKVFEISPNPAKSLINISSEDYISMVEIYSTAGRLVIQKQIDANMAEVNIEWLVPGVYFVRLFGESGHVPSVQRFVKE